MTFETNVVGFPKTYANICKIWKLRRAIFPVFYKISPPIFFSLLILNALFSNDVSFVNLAWIKIESTMRIVY